MSTISKQWLQQTIGEMEATRDEIPFGLDEDDSNTLAAMKLALASLETECHHEWSFGGENKLQSQKQCVKCGRVELAAPPAPVSVPDLKELEAVLNWILMLPCPTPKATYFAKKLAVVIDTCRAAMLQGADGSSPVVQDGWVACSERMPEIGQKVFYYFDIVGVHAGYYDGDNTFVKENGGGWLTGDVTHWMEWILPAPPKREV